MITKVMKKVILMSVNPKYLVDILNEQKTLEIRKKFPKDYTGWVYVYCTKQKPFLAEENVSYDSDGYDCSFVGYSLFDTMQEIYDSGNDDEWPINGKVVCKFWVEKVEEITPECLSHYIGIPSFITPTLSACNLCNKSCLTKDDLFNYLKPNGPLEKSGYAIHISNMQIIEPIELSNSNIRFFTYVKKWIDCGMDCPPYVDEVEKSITKAPQSWQYAWVEL